LKKKSTDLEKNIATVNREVSAAEDSVKKIQWEKNERVMELCIKASDTMDKNY
jgi:hypothetical protein